jgi:YidC/Oxa1 family membrane protein insertase
MLLAQFPADAVAGIQNVLDKKSAIENFFGIVLTENTGLVWPSIIIPVICVAATFLSSYLSTKQTKSTDPNMKMQQNMMMVVMPVMIGFMTIGMPAGVGLYWAASNITQIIQQVSLNKIFNKPDIKNNDNGEIVDPKPAKGKPAGKK